MPANSFVEQLNYYLVISAGPTKSSWFYPNNFKLWRVLNLLASKEMVQGEPNLQAHNELPGPHASKKVVEVPDLLVYMKVLQKVVEVEVVAVELFANITMKVTNSYEYMKLVLGVLLVVVVEVVAVMFEAAGFLMSKSLLFKPVDANTVPNWMDESAELYFGMALAVACAGRKFAYCIKK